MYIKYININIVNLSIYQYQYLVYQYIQTIASIWRENMLGYLSADIRDLTQNTMATATRTSPNKRFNEENNGCARAL